MRTQTVTESRVHATSEYSYFADADQLGLQPFSMPAVIPTQLGNAEPFIFQRAEIDRYFYWQLHGFIELIVKI